MPAWVRSALSIVALAANLAGIFLWWRSPPSLRAETRARALYDEAREAERGRRYVEARHLYRFAAAAYPATVFGERAAYQAGLAAMNAVGDLAGARAAFAAYLERYPQGVFAEKAREHAALLAEVPAEPADAGVRYLRAENLISLGRLEDAELLLLDLSRREISGAFAEHVGRRLEWVRATLVGQK